MLLVANRGAGQFVAYPDVCLTPPVPVPIPYVNVAFNATAVLFSPNIFTSMLPTLWQSSILATSIGDEPGVAHPVIKGIGVVKLGLFPHVLFNFLPVATLAAPTTGNTFNAPIGLIAVPSATNVFVCCDLEAAGAGEPDALAVARALERDSVDDVRILEDGVVGHLAIRVFSIDVPARVYAALRRFEAAGVERLVLDLRGCPGGELTAAVELASDFLPAGAWIASVVEDDGFETTYVARGHDRAPWRGSVELRVDGATASAAEIFAAALARHGAALVGPPMAPRHGATAHGPGTSRAHAAVPHAGPSEGR